MAHAPSSRFQVPTRWLAAAPLLLGGCGGIGVNSPTLGAYSAADDGGASPETDAGGGHPSDRITPSDAGVGAFEAAGPSVYMGSPLCMQLTSSPVCNPDKPACISGAYDGGPNLCTSEVSLCNVDSGTPNIPAACRVEASGPTCELGPNYNEQATQGASCSNSSECGVGFECIGDSQHGTCKHYCCDPTTCDSASGTGYASTRPFCDIENAVSGQPVPVCTTAQSCVPLTDACSTGMTCTIVNSETAQAACVKTGGGQYGDSCTRDKCGPDLACVSGTCRQLCKTSESTCPAGLRCIPPSAYGSLRDIGLCQ